MIDLKRHWPLALAIALIVALGTGLLVAQSDAAVLKCDLAPASSVMNARIKATCVRAHELAVKIGDERGVRARTSVSSEACSSVQQSTYLWDCHFAIFLDAGHGFRAQTCGGVVRVRGRSTHPRRLVVHLLRQNCT